MDRSEVQSNYKWKTTDIFESDEKWEEAFKALEGKLDFNKFCGTLSNAENILAYFSAEENFTR